MAPLKGWPGWSLQDFVSGCFMLLHVWYVGDLDYLNHVETNIFVRFSMVEQHFCGQVGPTAVQPGNPEIPAGAESGCPPRVSYSRRPFTNPVGVTTNDQRNVCKMGKKTDLRWVWFTRSILDGYFNPLVFFLVSMGISTNQQRFFFCRVSKIGNVYIGLSLIVIHDLLSLYCPTL